MPTGRRLVAALVDLAAVLTIATTANFGGLTVVSAAERTCKALITIISQSSPKQVLHHSAKTLAAWAAWNKAHPNYHPPHHSPPMSREQAQRWVDSACAQLMPIDPSQPDIFLEPAPSDGLLADNTAPSTFTLFPEEIPLDTVLPTEPMAQWVPFTEDVAQATPPDTGDGGGYDGWGWWVIYPGIPGWWGPPPPGPPSGPPSGPPGPIALTPECPTLLLLGTGLLLLAAGMLGAWLRAWLRSWRCSWHWSWLRFPASSSRS